MELDETSLPNFALVPSKIAAGALEVGYPPWEVYDALVNFEEDKSDKVKKLLKPCKDWALAAALRGLAAPVRDMFWKCPVLVPVPLFWAKTHICPDTNSAQIIAKELSSCPERVQ